MSPRCLHPPPIPSRWCPLLHSLVVIPFLLLLLPITSTVADDISAPLLASSPSNASLPLNNSAEFGIIGGNDSETQQSGGSAERALAAPILRGKVAENAVEVNGERKPFIKIHYRDGFQKAIFDETQQRKVLPDFEDTNDVSRGEFDTYEDSRLVDPRLEQPLFIPEIYRNDTSADEKGPPRGPAPQQGANPGRPLVATELQNRQPITVRTTTARSFLGPPPPANRPPSQPFGRQPPPPGPPRPPQGFPPRQPPPLPSATNFPPQQPFRPPSQPFPQLPQPFPARPSPLPQQPQVPRPPTFLPPLPPPNPPTNQQRPTPNSALGQLRTGVCPHSVFYTPQAVTEFDLQRIYTHFALVVSIDQCARTCHEFNCDVAILDPISRHCQFNPSTSFRLHPSCPQWPNPLYRNNVQLSRDPVRIACVTCQQRRRIPRPDQNSPSPMPFNGLSRQQQQSFTVPRQTLSQQPQPQQPNVIRTTVRDRIDAGPNNDAPFRIANAARLHGEETAEGGRDLSGEFHKLERLLKSAEEDYLDGAAEQAKGKGKHADAKRKKGGKGREVPSWRDGHPQGDGHSPLKINPLRRPFLTTVDKPHAIFYSTDKLGQRKRENSDEFRRRSHRGIGEHEEQQQLLHKVELLASDQKAEQ